MKTKVKIENIIKKPKDDLPGLVEISVSDERYYIEMNVDVYDKLPPIGSVVDAELIIYPVDSYDVYKNEDEFNKEKKGALASQSIIPLGKLLSDQAIQEKNSQNFINGKVIDMKEYEDYYLVNLESLKIIYSAILKKKDGIKPEIGNILSSTYSVEMELYQEAKQWS